MGLQRNHRPARLRRRFIHRILKAVRRLGPTSRPVSLGEHPVGVGDIRIECLTSDSNTASVYLFGFSDNLPIYEIYREWIAPGTVVIDVGANVGMHSLVMAHYAAHGRVYSYEPSPAIYQRLGHNLQINQARNVEPRMLAVSSRPGCVGFADASSKPNIGTSRVDAAAYTTVPAVTLDDELVAVPAVSLIKIDVEGHELEVLRGAGTVLAIHRPAVVLEFNGTSYSLADLCACFPYSVRILRIPDTFYQVIREVHPNSHEPAPRTFNALVVPLSGHDPG
jgi:FkbM family methyltransferase